MTDDDHDNDERYPFPAPDPGGNPTASDGGGGDDQELETVVDHDHVAIRRERRDGEPDLFHVEDALERLKTFESKAKAELYADVYTVVGGFREEKTGERGVPPAIAAAREDVLMAYLTAQPTMSLQWAARFFDEDEAVVRRYVNAVQDRAAEQRANEGDDTQP